MGSYFETDGLTQLPILHGDKVRVFLLIHKDKRYPSHKNGTSYPDELWSPLALPFQASYYDYGYVDKIIETEHTQILFDRFEYKQSFQDLIKEICAGDKVYAGASPLETGKLSTMLVLEDIYQNLICEYKKQICAHQFAKHYKYMTVEESINISFKEWYNDNLSDEDKVTFGKLFPYYLTGRSRYFLPYTDKLKALFKEKEPFESPKVQSFISPLMDMVLFCEIMDDLRKIWIPQGGKGSQQDDGRLYSTLAQTTLDILKKRDEDEIERDAEGYKDYERQHNQDLKKEDL